MRILAPNSCRLRMTFSKRTLNLCVILCSLISYSYQGISQFNEKKSFNYFVTIKQTFLMLGNKANTN